MNAAMAANTQRGLALSHFLAWAVALVVAAIFGMKLVPAYIEEKTIQHALDELAHKPEMQDAQPQEIQSAFDKYALVEHITAVSSGDVTIDKVNNTLVLSAKYHVKIPLAGNVSLWVDFNPSSARPR